MLLCSINLHVAAPVLISASTATPTRKAGSAAPLRVRPRVQFTTHCYKAPLNIYTLPTNNPYLMPPVSKGKRKTDSTDILNDDDAASDAKNARVGESPQDKAPASAMNLAKSMFLAEASKPFPEALSSGGGADIKVEGIVVDVKKIQVAGKKGSQVPKLQVTVFASKITGVGNSPVVTTGVPGHAYGIPVRHMEASPEEIAVDANAKGPIVIDSNPNEKAAYLGYIQTSFYVDGADSKAPKKEAPVGKAPSAEACTVGTRVILSGVMAQFGKQKDKESTEPVPLYVNAKKIQALQDSVPTVLAARNIIQESRTPAVQITSSLLLSAAAHGFFNVDYGEDEARREQAEAFKTKWDAMLQHAAARCDALGATTASAECHALYSHGQRIRGMKAYEAAQGQIMFNCDMQKDCTTPYVAALVQYGRNPGDVVGDACCALFDEKRRASMPASFCDAVVSNVSVKGNLITLDYGLFFVGDTDFAIKQIEKNKNPVLKTQYVAARVKLTKRAFGPERIGTTVSPKIDMATMEMMFSMNHVAFAKVFPCAADSNSVDGHFTVTTGYDIVDGIRKVGVQVTKEWVDTKMLGGRGVFIHKHPDDATLVEPANGIGPAPTLSKNGYQAISEGSFEFDSLVPPKDMVVKYFVVYSGCSENAKNNPAITTSVDEGERHLDDIVPAHREDGDVRAFLRNDAIVYAVAE